MSPIQVCRDLCLVHRYKKMKCNLCRESCPVAAIDKDLSITAACDDCGICLAVCPAEAIAGENYRPAALQKAVQGNGSLLLNCTKQNSSSDWPCLGFLDARLLIGLALTMNEDRTILIDDSGCENCRVKVKEQLVNSVERANVLLSYFVRPLIKIGDCARTIKDNANLLSRRNFFSQLFGAAIETVSEVVLPAATASEPLKRYLFFSQIDEKRLELPECARQQVLTTVAVTSSCRACGLCAKVCPNKAIIVAEKGEAEIQLYHNPLLCTRCGVCAALCPQQAICFKWAGKLKTHLVANVSLPQCGCCGNYYQPMGEGELCLECKLKNQSTLTKTVGEVNRGE